MALQGFATETFREQEEEVFIESVAAELGVDPTDIAITDVVAAASPRRHLSHVHPAHRLLAARNGIIVMFEVKSAPPHTTEQSGGARAAHLIAAKLTSPADFTSRLRATMAAANLAAPPSLNVALVAAPSAERILCDPGFFFEDATATAQGRCAPCPAGKFKPAAGSAGATLGQDCGDSHLAASERKKHAGACIACDTYAAGADCSASGSSLATLKSRRGFWRATTATATFHACNPLNEGECRGGAIPANGTRDAQCAKGHAGPKCEPCDRDHDPAYVRKFGGVCGTCAPGEGLGVMLVAPAAVLLLVAFAWFLYRYHAAKLRGLNGWVTKRTIKTRILFGFVATVTRTPLVYGLQMPSVVARFYQALGFLELFDLSGFISNAACLLRSDYTTKVYVQTGLALGMFALLGAAYARARCRGARASSRHEQRTAGGSVANGALFFAFLVFAPLMTTLLLAYGCTRYEDGRSYLAADLSIDCTDAHYRAMLEWAGFCVAIFVAGIPLVYFVLLYRHRAALQPEPRTADERQEARVLGLDAWSHLMRADDPKIQHLSFLWSGYTPGCWWFEVFEMARKFLITGVPILLTLAV
eukprot:g4522.t1